MGEGKASKNSFDVRSKGQARGAFEPELEARPERSDERLSNRIGGEIVVKRRTFVHDDEARRGGVVWVGEKVVGGGGEHVGEANVHVDLDVSGRLLTELVGRASTLREGVSGALWAGGTEKLTNGAKGSNSFGQVELLAEVFRGTILFEQAEPGDAFGNGGRDVALSEVVVELLAERVRGNRENGGTRL